MKSFIKAGWYFMICPILALSIQYVIIVFAVLSSLGGSILGLDKFDNKTFYIDIVIGNILLLGLLLILARIKGMNRLNIAYAVVCCILSFLVYRFRLIPVM